MSFFGPPVCAIERTQSVEKCDLCGRVRVCRENTHGYFPENWRRFEGESPRTLGFLLRMLESLVWKCCFLLTFMCGFVLLQNVYDCFLAAENNFCNLLHSFFSLLNFEPWNHLIGLKINRLSNFYDLVFIINSFFTGEPKICVSCAVLCPCPWPWGPGGGRNFRRHTTGMFIWPFTLTDYEQVKVLKLFVKDRSGSVLISTPLPVQLCSNCPFRVLWYT